MIYFIFLSQTATGYPVTQRMMLKIVWPGFQARSAQITPYVYKILQMHATAAVNDQRCSQRMSRLHRLNCLEDMISGWYEVNFELLGDEHLSDHMISTWYPHDIRIPHLSFYHVLSFICSHLFSTFHSAVAGGAGGCWGHHRALQSGSTERCPGKEGKELPYD